MEKLIEALENLKEWSHHCDCEWLLANGSYVITDGHEPEKAIKNIGESLRELADVIQAEVDECYMRLPVDADGEVIRIGDSVALDGLSDGYRFDTVGYVEIGGILHVLDGRHKAYLPRCLEHRRRTIEDVLLDLVNDTAKQGHQIGLTAQEIVAKYADEIRELMQDD